jgi:hypothetical protein
MPDMAKQSVVLSYAKDGEFSVQCQQVESSHKRPGRCMHGGAELKALPRMLMHEGWNVSASSYSTSTVDRKRSSRLHRFLMASEDASVASMIHTLNSAILAATLALIPKLDPGHASDLHQASQRLQIWSNDLGVGDGELGKRLRDQQELEYSIVTLHIMIAQGLVAAGMFILFL